MLNLSSVSLPFPPLGNDLEALQIHLCFCCSNLHPRRAARSGSTLVSAVSNIYLSQQKGEKPGSCWRLQTGRQSYQLVTCSLPAESCFVKRIWDGLDLSLPTASPPASAQDETKPYPLIPAFTYFFVFVLLLSFFLRAVDQSLIFLGFIFPLSFLRDFFFTFIGLGWLHLYMYIHMCIYSIYCMKDFFPILKET